jgi:hypothetical protein
MPKTIKKITRKFRRSRSLKRTLCSSQHLASFEKEIVVKFLETLNTIKLFHWKTHSYATHKATDELYSKINDNVDTFIEVLLGKCGNRIHLEHVKHISLKDFNHVEDFKREMENFKSYLIGLNSNKGLQVMSNSDLYNIRDELLANVNQFLYLLTFK